MAGWLMDNVIAWIAERVVAMLEGLLALLSATVFTSPDVTVFPQVRLLASRSALLVSAAFLFAVIAAGVIAMTHGTFHVRYQAKDLLPRLVFGFIASFPAGGDPAGQYRSCPATGRPAAPALRRLPPQDPLQRPHPGAGPTRHHHRRHRRRTRHYRRGDRGATRPISRRRAAHRPR
jgi:hypothetical protein